MRIFLFVTLLLAFYFVKSQSALTSYSCTLFGTSTKFSNRSALEIDKFNNKWIGFSNTDTTYKSLIKYDGTWTDYSSSIHDAVLSLSSDNAGTIWIGTKTKGLCKFDGSNFIFYDTLNSNIPSNQVNALLFTNNIIYIGTTKGLSEFDGSTFNNLNTTNSAIMCDTITCLESDPSGNIWIGTYTGLHKMDPSNNFDTPYQTFTPITDLAFDSPHNSIGILYNSNLRNLDMQYLPVPQQDSNFCINCLNPANPVIGIGRDSDGNILYSRGAGPLVEPLTNPLILYSAGTLAFKFKCDTSGILYYIRNGPATKLFLYSFNDSLYVESTANSFIYETKLNSKTLRANKVRVLCTAGGDQGYNNMPGYEVPVLSNKFTTFTSALWLGGYSSGQLRTSAATYRQNGLDFWPGPINSANGTVDTAVVLQYNRVWKVSRSEIIEFINQYNLGNVQNGSYTVPNDIAQWPWQSPDGEMLAPFFDNNNDLQYNILDGDYPAIKGDEMAWWVLNDVFANHTESNSSGKIGMQVEVSAYQFNCSALTSADTVINYTTFYNYKVRNKGNIYLDSAVFGLLVDPDLGYYNDDYIGCDVSNNFSYVYNGDSYDQDGNGVNGYHTNTPIMSYAILKGPEAPVSDGIDNDHDGCIDCTFNKDANGNILGQTNDNIIPENFGLSSFRLILNTFDTKKGNVSNTGNGIEYYNAMNGLWNDGTQVHYDTLTGITSGGLPTKHIFPGNSDPYGYCIGGSPSNPLLQTPWTEKSANLTPGDRRMLMGMGSLNFHPGSVQELDFAFIFTQDYNSLQNGTILDLATQNAKHIKSWYELNYATPCMDISTLGINQNKATNRSDELTLFPNPSSRQIEVILNNGSNINKIIITDVLGKTLVEKYTNDFKIYLDISQLQTGVYFVKTYSEQGIFSAKFIKE